VDWLVLLCDVHAHLALRAATVVAAAVAVVVAAPSGLSPTNKD
jgi:hypothetical protein